MVGSSVLSQLSVIRRVAFSARRDGLFATSSKSRCCMHVPRFRVGFKRNMKLFPQQESGFSRFVSVPSLRSLPLGRGFVPKWGNFKWLVFSSLPFTTKRVSPTEKDIFKCGHPQNSWFPFGVPSRHHPPFQYPEINKHLR